MSATLRLLVWWHQWGQVLFLVVAVGAIVYIAVDGFRRGGGISGWIVGAAAPLCLVLPSLTNTGHLRKAIAALASTDTQVVNAAITALRGYVVWTYLAMVGSVLPLVAAAVYHALRTEAQPGSVCDSCGKPLRLEWGRCPYCSEQPAAETGSTERGPAHTVLIKREPPVLAWLIVKSGKLAGKEYRLRADVTDIGREPANHIVVEDEAASRQHARIKYEDGQFVIFDLASANHTFVNDEQVLKHALADGDSVRIGQTQLVFKRV